MHKPIHCETHVHSLFWPVSNLHDVSGSRSKIKASVVVTLHPRPVCDPVLFLGLLRLKLEIELIPFGL